MTVEQPKKNITLNQYDAGGLLSIQDVADFLQLSVPSVRKLRITGKLCPAFKVGRHLRWKRSDLLAWLEDQADPD